MHLRKREHQNPPWMTPDQRNTTLTFDPGCYPFHEIIAACIGVSPAELSGLRADLPPERYEAGGSIYKHIERADAHRALYAGLDGPRGADFYATYAAFVREEIAPQFDVPISYQLKPSHRILFLDAPGESRYHRDRDYGHDPAECNFFVPQTRAHATNSMFVESAPGAGDFAPAELSLGEYLRFDGANCAHGAHVNQTGRTRVSFDFRVIPSHLTAPTPGDLSGNPVQDNALRFVEL